MEYCEICGLEIVGENAPVYEPEEKGWSNSDYFNICQDCLNLYQGN